MYLPVYDKPTTQLSSSPPNLVYNLLVKHLDYRRRVSSSFRGFPKNFGILSSEACFLLFLGFTREISTILGSTRI